MTVVASYECTFADSTITASISDAGEAHDAIVAHLEANPLHSYRVMLRWA